jgi:adenosylcobinamide-phosphate synthase
MAGALGVRLAGPRVYGGVATDDPPMNAGGRAALEPADLRRALRLYRVADGLLLVGLAGLWAATA